MSTKLASVAQGSDTSTNVRRHRRRWDPYSRLAAALATASTAVMMLIPLAMTS